ncbi:MAG TPA: sugar ABC transporter ATP-binding protein, partial [bacterium]|nr:sugar ABC transporter ATP-binding protein [bacterium]
PDTDVRALSGGNQQRALLALLPDHLTLLLMEHPTRGLDLESAEEIWRRLLERRAHGTAIVFSSSDLDELLDRSDRIVVFSGGRVASPVDSRGATVEQLGRLIGGRGF